ncbi:hypothetical protein ACA910_003774 [Epithemia clementina (nom. ined.)]
MATPSSSSSSSSPHYRQVLRRRIAPAKDQEESASGVGGNSSESSSNNSNSKRLQSTNNSNKKDSPQKQRSQEEEQEPSNLDPQSSAKRKHLISRSFSNRVDTATTKTKTPPIVPRTPSSKTAITTISTSTSSIVSVSTTSKSRQSQPQPQQPQQRSYPESSSKQKQQQQRQEQEQMQQQSFSTRSTPRTQTSLWRNSPRSSRERQQQQSSSNSPSASTKTFSPSKMNRYSSQGQHNNSSQNGKNNNTTEDDDNERHQSDSSVERKRRQSSPASRKYRTFPSSVTRQHAPKHRGAKEDHEEGDDENSGSQHSVVPHVVRTTTTTPRSAGAAGATAAAYSSNNKFQAKQQQQHSQSSASSRQSEQRDPSSSASSSTAPQQHAAILSSVQKEAKSLPRDENQACISASLLMLRTAMDNNSTAYEYLFQTPNDSNHSNRNPPSSGQQSQVADPSMTVTTNSNRYDGGSGSSSGNHHWLSLVEELQHRRAQETSQLKQDLQQAKAKSKHYKEELRENLTERLQLLEERVLSQQQQQQRDRYALYNNLGAGGESVTVATLASTDNGSSATFEDGATYHSYALTLSNDQNHMMPQFLDQTLLQERLEQTQQEFSREKKEWLRRLEILESRYSADLENWQRELAQLKDDSRRLLAERDQLLKEKNNNHKQQLLRQNGEGEDQTLTMSATKLKSRLDQTKKERDEALSLLGELQEEYDLLQQELEYSRAKAKEAKRRGAKEARKLYQEELKALDEPIADVEALYRETAEQRRGLQSRLRHVELQHANDKATWKLQLECALASARNVATEHEYVQNQLDEALEKHAREKQEWQRNLDANMEQLKEQLKAEKEEGIQAATVEQEQQHEVHLGEWKEQVQEVQEQLNSTEAQLKRVKEQDRKSQEKLRQAEDRLSKLESEKKAAQVSASWLSDKLDKAEEEHSRRIEKLEKQLADAEHQVLTLGALADEAPRPKKELQESRLDAVRMSDKLIETQKKHSKELATLKDKHKLELREQQMSAHVSQGGSLDSLVREKQELEESLEELKRDYEVAAKELEQWKAAAEELEKNLDHVMKSEVASAENHQEQLDFVQNQKQELSEQIEELEQEIVSAKDMAKTAFAEQEESRQQMEQQVNELREENEALTMTNKVLEETIATLQDRIAQLKSGHAKEMEELKATHAKELEQFESRHANVEQFEATRDQEMKQLKSEHAEEMEQLKSGHAEEMEQLKSGHAEEMEQLKSELAEEMEQLKSEHAQEMDEVKFEYTVQVEQLKSEHTILEQLKATHAKEIEQLKSKQSKEIRQLEDRLEETENLWTNKEEQWAKKLESSQREVSSLERHCQEVDTLAANQESRWNSESEAYQARITALEEECEQLKVQMEAQENEWKAKFQVHESRAKDADAEARAVQELRHTKSNHSKEVADLLRKLSDCEKENQDLEQQHLKALRDLETKHTADMHAITQIHEQKVKDLVKDLADARAELQIMTDQSNMLASSLEEVNTLNENKTTHWETEIDRLEQENAKLRNLALADREGAIRIQERIASGLEKHQKELSCAVLELRDDLATVREANSGANRSGLKQINIHDLVESVDKIHSSIHDTLAEITLETENLIECRNGILEMVERTSALLGPENSLREQMKSLEDTLAKALHLGLTSSSSEPSTALTTCMGELSAVKELLARERHLNKDTKRLLDEKMNQLSVEKEKREKADQKAQSFEEQAEHLEFEQKMRVKAEQEIVTLNDQADAYGEELMRLQALNRNLEETLRDAERRMEAALATSATAEVVAVGEEPILPPVVGDSSPMLDEALALAQNLTALIKGQNDAERETSVMEMLETMSEMIDKTDTSGSSKSPPLRHINIPVKVRFPSPPNKKDYNEDDDVDPDENPPLPISSPVITTRNTTSGELTLVVEQLYSRCQLLERERTEIMEVTLDVLQSAREASSAELEAALATARRKAAEEILKVREENRQSVWRLYHKLCGNCQHGIAASSGSQHKTSCK